MPDEGGPTCIVEGLRRAMAGYHDWDVGPVSDGGPLMDCGVAEAALWGSSHV